MSQLSPVDLWHKLWQTRYLSPLSDHCFHIRHVKMSFSPLLLQISNRIIQSLPVAMKTKQVAEGGREREKYRKKQRWREPFYIHHLNPSFNQHNWLYGVGKYFVKIKKMTKIAQRGQWSLHPCVRLLSFILVFFFLWEICLFFMPIHCLLFTSFLFFVLFYLTHVSLLVDKKLEEIFFISYIF